jgi:hypothetical protein
LTVGGTARPGVDYAPLASGGSGGSGGGSVIIPASASSVPIPVIPLDDSGNEAGEATTPTVVIVLSTSPSYTLGSSFSATVNINDTEPPAAATVTSVASTAADGTYRAGATIPITVTFTSPVNVSGTPQIALSSGGTANYTCGSGSSTLTFS